MGQTSGLWFSMDQITMMKNISVYVNPQREGKGGLRLAQGLLVALVCIHPILGLNKRGEKSGYIWQPTQLHHVPIIMLMLSIAFLH